MKKVSHLFSVVTCTIILHTSIYTMPSADSTEPLEQTTAPELAIAQETIPTADPSSPATSTTPPPTTKQEIPTTATSLPTTPSTIPSETTTTTMPSTTPKTSTTPTQSIPNPSSTIQQHELAELDTYINSIQATKDELRKLLAQIDEKINQGKGIVTQARKRSMEILGQKDDASAKAIVDEITNSATELKKIQTELSGSLSKTFQNDVEKIQQTITSMNTALTQLKAKQSAIQITQAAEQQKEPAKQDQEKSQPRNWFIPENVSGQPTEQKTVLHYVFNKMADFISEIIRYIYIFFQQIKDAWSNTKKTVQQPPQTLPQTMPAPEQAPVMPPASNTPQKTSATPQ